MPHFPEVVKFVHENRFATAAQVRRRFAEQMPSERTSQYQLAGLVQLGYLQTAPVRSTSPNFPFVYHAAKRGLRFLQKTFGNGASPAAYDDVRVRGASLHSMLHEVLLTEFDLAVWRTVEHAPHLERLFVERRYYRRENQLRCRWEGEAVRVIPDSGFMLQINQPTASSESKDDSALLLHFTELDNGTLSPTRILDKYRRYERWAASEEGERYLRRIYARHGRRHARPTFRLLVIAHRDGSPAGDGRRLRELFAPTLGLSSAMRKRIWLTTAAALQSHDGAPAPLAAPIWTRVRDANHWLDEHRDSIANLPRKPGRKSSLHRPEYTPQRQTAMPRRALFPIPTE